MSYITADMVWPEPTIPKPFRALVEKLLELGDSNDADAASRMAVEVFSPDGVFDHGSYKFVGRQEISNSRSKPKPGSKMIRRKHHVSRAYSQTARGDDFVVLGEVDVEFENGTTVHNQFAARAVVDQSTIDSEPRLALWAMYIASFPPLLI
ncbi:hypothetical protein AYO20_08108 [Fonsecaea nubica]|uniref:SnoaL-like domain-containing protein n=1 Tax=Fonsecaea nubica TaxID=856822 RepID=A0A178CS24_9EURO|nr:hypothetical protein AYO20_08108 [Fonsecaea nubica]OAL31715.1 hypothetical protein AYO20_08108 [Fonsecaea nubica]